MDYEIVVGLEVHAELNTETKIYCSCKNSFGSEVNSNCCPVCTGMPGSLPVLNEKVVDYAIRMGHALGCKINNVCKQDRKNYFYPDLPKAYQISQYDVPLCEHGHLDIIMDEEGNTKSIGVTRIHIEEDAGKLLHSDRFAGSLVDLNRCGVPFLSRISAPPRRPRAIWMASVLSWVIWIFPTVRCRKAPSAAMSMCRFVPRAATPSAPV